MTDSVLTLAICTYNRADSLRCTLESVEQAWERSGSEQWEILLIDNNSTDHTPKVAEEFARRLPLRRLYEPKQGLSHARNCALDEFRGDLLVFTDDDVLVDEGWLSAYAGVGTLLPDADFFGGRVKPMWQTRRPGWLRDESMPLIAGLLVHYDVGNVDRQLEAKDPLPFGASFGLTKELVESIGRFRPDLGVKGNVGGRGEEENYLSRARDRGFRGAYLASALCHHPVDTRRLSLPYLYRYGIQKGITEVRMQEKQPKHGVRMELVYALRGVTQLARGRGDRFRQCVINMGIQRGLREGRAAH